MKLKDIKIGEEYAIRAPNSRYDRAFRARVTKIRVKGVRKSGWHYTATAGATHVEFELIGKGYASKYEYSWVIGEECLPRHYGTDDRPTEKRMRCPASHIIRPWAEEETANAAAEERKAESDRVKAERDERMKTLRLRAKALDIHVSTWKGEFTLDETGMAALLAMAEKAER